MTTRTIIKPERAGGFNDYGPLAMAQRRVLADRIRRVYQRYGFEELETPIVEFADVLTGEQDPSTRLFQTFVRSPGDSVEDAAEELSGTRSMFMRFDHTVPLARYVAANMSELSFPWRRQVFGPVFRGESTGSGRYHQFYQFDADIVGVDSLTADAEIINMMVMAMSELTSYKYTVRWNSRKLLNALAEVVGVTGTVVNNQSGRSEPKANILFRVLDRLEKAGWSKVQELLSRPPDNKWDDSALALSPDQITIVEHFVNLTTELSAFEALDQLDGIIGSTKIGREGIADMRLVYKLLEAMGTPSDRHEIDFSVARGLGYYDGIVFETIIEDAKSFGSVYSGGRFDGLISRFTGEPLPSTGASIGFDRLYAVLESLDDLPVVRVSPIEVLIMDFGDPENRLAAVAVMGMLRAGGVACEIYLGENARKMKAVISSAVHRGIKKMVIIGSSERDSGSATVKNLVTRKQETVSVHEVLSVLDL